MADKRSSRLQSIWNRRDSTWHEHVNSSPAFDLIRESVVAAAGVRADDTIVDLGSGTGFLSLELAAGASRVIAVDFSEPMLAKLRRDAELQGRTNVETQVADLSSFDLPVASVDLVVTNYALHHLRDPDKAALVGRASTWLRPGGRIVIADMMFGRGGSAEDRAIIATKVRRMVRHGPAGIWRIAKNVVRFSFRKGSERPVPSSFWIRELGAAGFVKIQHRQIVAEAGLVTARLGTPVPVDR